MAPTGLITSWQMRLEISAASSRSPMRRRLGHGLPLRNFRFVAEMNVAPHPKSASIGGRASAREGRASMRATNNESPHGKHLALSAPRHTTQRDTAAASSSAAFDFATAAALLTDAAARAGAAIMRALPRGAAGRAQGRCEPGHPRRQGLRGDHPRSPCSGFAPEIPVVSEEAADDRGADLGPASSSSIRSTAPRNSSRSARDFTVNIALIENGAPALRPRLCAGARAARADAADDGAAIEAELPPSDEGADLAKLRQKPLTRARRDPKAWSPWSAYSHLDAATEAFLAKLKIARRSSAGSSLKFLRDRARRGRRLSALRPDHGMGHGGGPCGAERRRRAGGRPPRASRSATARPRRACAIRASSPGALAPGQLTQRARRASWHDRECPAATRRCLAQTASRPRQTAPAPPPRSRARSGKSRHEAIGGLLALAYAILAAIGAPRLLDQLARAQPTRLRVDCASHCQCRGSSVTSRATTPSLGRPGPRAGFRLALRRR